MKHFPPMAAVVVAQVFEEREDGERVDQDVGVEGEEGVGLLQAHGGQQFVAQPGHLPVAPPGPVPSVVAGRHG
jgi:hypothetical protein